MSAESATSGGIAMSMRLPLVLAACLQTFLCGGLVFGWASISTSLLILNKSEGGLGLSAEVVQKTFVAASSTCMASPLLMGPIVDMVGPRLGSAISIAVVGVGFAIVGSSMSLFTVGMVLIALGGPGLQNAAIRLSSLFPGREATVTSAIASSFQLSFIVFEIFEKLWELTGVSGQVLFLGYAGLCLFSLLLSLFLWQDPMQQKTSKAEGPVVLSSESLIQQALSRPFLQLALLLPVGAFWSNLYIGSVGTQLQEQGMLPATTQQHCMDALTLLTAAGAFSFPISGYLMDRKGYPATLACVLAMGVAWTISVLLARSAWMLILSFAIYSLYRSMLFNYFFAYLAHALGFQHYGSLTGIAMAFAGICSLLQDPVFSFGQGSCKYVEGRCPSNQWQMVHIAQLAAMVSLYGLLMLSEENIFGKSGNALSLEAGSRGNGELDAIAAKLPASYTEAQ